MVLIFPDDTKLVAAATGRLGSLVQEYPLQSGRCGAYRFLLMSGASDEIQTAAMECEGLLAAFPEQAFVLGQKILSGMAENPDPLRATGAVSARAAFQGVRGAYSEMAIRKYFGDDAVCVPFPKFRDVFEAVLSGQVPVGVLPFENALTGSIHDNYDLLMEFPDLSLCGEVLVRINHNLIGLPDAKLTDVKRVFSHPQGLLQCADYLSRFPDWEQVPFYDTAGSVEHVRNLGEKSNAAIASSNAAREYDLKIIEEGIETNQANYTRFGVIVRNDCPSVPLNFPIEDLKASVVFSLPHRPGTLLNCMQVLGDEEMNLTKIESRPIHGKPWEYLFYLDMELNGRPDRFHVAATMLGGMTDDFRILGLYPKARPA